MVEQPESAAPSEDLQCP